MSLLESMMEPFVILNKSKISDGEGGFILTWEDGPEILAIATQDTTMQARIAEKEGVTSIYTITTNKSVLLEFHDVLKRKKDGRIFRITSDSSDKVSPSMSSLDIAQATAERWELSI